MKEIYETLFKKNEEKETYKIKKMLEDKDNKYNVEETDKVVSISVNDIEQHFLVIGSSGAGKSVLMKRITKQILSVFEKTEHNYCCLRHTVKPDLLKQFYDKDKDYIFNPVDPRTINFNIFSGIKYSFDFREIAVALCQQEGPKNGASKFFEDSNVALFEAIMKKCKHDYITGESDKLTNHSLKKYMAMTRGNLVKELKKLPKEENVSTAIAVIEGEGAQADNVFASFKATVGEVIGVLTRMNEEGKEDFDIEDFLNNSRGRTLFLCNPPQYQKFVSPILSLFLDTCIQIGLSRDDSLNPNPNKVFFEIDELGELPKIQRLGQLITLGRGYGLIAGLGVQDKEKTKRKYTDETESIINSCGVKIIFRVSSADIQKMCSDILGERKISRFTEGKSVRSGENGDGTSFSEQIVTEKAVLASTLGDMFKHEYYLKTPSTRGCVHVQSWYDPEIDSIKDRNDIGFLVAKEFTINIKEERENFLKNSFDY